MTVSIPARWNSGPSSRSGAVRIGGPALIAGIALWPFIQLGLTYYASVATAALFLTLVAFHRLFFSAASRALIYTALVVPLMCLSLLSAPSNLDDVLRVGRESLIFSLLIFTLVGVRQMKFEVNTRALFTVICAVAVGELLLTIIQSVAIPRRIFITFPRELFVQNAATLPDLLDLIYSRIRPSGTFGEPSYLGFICISVALAVSPYIVRSRKATVAFGCAIAAGVMSQSAAFIIATAILMPFAIGAAGLIRLNARTVAAVVGGVAALSFFMISIVISRFNTENGTLDASMQVRLITPFLAATSYLTAFPVGTSISSSIPELASIVGSSVSANELPTQNAMFNLLFSYGYVGLITLAVLIYLAPSITIGIYIVIMTNFNGSFLSIDKMAVMATAIVLFTSGIRSVRQRR